MRALFDGFKRVTDIGHQSRDYHATLSPFSLFFFLSLITFHFGRDKNVQPSWPKANYQSRLQQTGNICQVGVAEVAAGSLNFGNMSSST